MVIHPYRFKPSPRFYGEDGWYVGMELEVIPPDRDARSKVIDLWRRPREVYVKLDGTIKPLGLEFVTHPISPDLWLEKNPVSGPVATLFKRLKVLRDMGYTSHDNGKCGMHFHVSLQAWNYPGWDATIPDSLFRFRELFKGELVRKISQRTPGQIEGTCSQEYRSRRKGSRYLATSFSGFKTLEVRIFRGNTREKRVRKAIECVIAAVRWSNEDETMLRSEEDSFLCYLYKRHKQYPHLISYLEEVYLSGGERNTTIQEEKTQCVSSL